MVCNAPRLIAGKAFACLFVMLEAFRWRLLFPSASHHQHTKWFTSARCKILAGAAVGVSSF